ncbi:DUF4917 family protein [Pontibacter rugosus]|uniref:DUF4917 family protein n=1 Tax=Pontibacter rugosus TaxID=1745966 RepID=A0ABW3SSQ4_9BACT
MELIPFAEAIQIAKKENKKINLLLGNGFSMAWRSDIFGYGALFDKADFSKLSPNAKRVFEALNTKDFESVMKALKSTSEIIKLYSEDTGLYDILLKDAEGLKEILVKAIADSHPEHPGEISTEAYHFCKMFLSNFDSIFTLNYDLLLYWTLMQNEIEPALNPDDGFRKSKTDQNAPYVTWDINESWSQKIFYLHGALHVVDAGHEIRKFTWNKTNVKLIDQIQQTLQNDDFPLFVSEGESAQKLSRIRHSDLLTDGYKHFSDSFLPLFIYGHSLDDNDDHILNLLTHNRISTLFISIYGNPESENNKRIIQKAEFIQEQRELMKRHKTHLPHLTTYYYDAESAHVWA